MMKRAILVLLTNLCLSAFLFAEQTSTEVLKGENGEIVTKIHYVNEKDGMILKEFYGNAPKYRLLIIYFDETNPKYYDRREYYDLDISDPALVPGKVSGSIDYYRTSDPEQQVSSVWSRKGEVVTVTTEYRPGNRKNLKWQMLETSDGVHLISQQDTYEDPTKNDDRILAKRTIYDSNGEVSLIRAKFSQNDKYLDEEEVAYRPPEFSEAKKKPFRSVSTYVNHPQGITQVLKEYDLQGGSVEFYTFDSARNKDGISRIMKLSLSTGLIKQVTFFDNKPLDGRIASATSVPNSDGTWTITYYDKAGNMVVAPKR